MDDLGVRPFQEIPISYRWVNHIIQWIGLGEKILL
jgi:hypothetical protein